MAAPTLRSTARRTDSTDGTRHHRGGRPVALLANQTNQTGTTAVAFRGVPSWLVNGGRAHVTVAHIANQSPLTGRTAEPSPLWTTTPPPGTLRVSCGAAPCCPQAPTP
jgi:hypothetical protein